MLFIPKGITLLCTVLTKVGKCMPYTLCVIVFCYLLLSNVIYYKIIV